MTEKTKKGGAGKFFLGAMLGSIAGALASKFISAKNGEGSAKCACGDKCECSKKEAEGKKDDSKKTTTKKPAEKTTKK